MVSSFIFNQLFSNLFVATQQCQIKIKDNKPFSNNWYTIETHPIDPFVLEGLPPFTIATFGR